MDDSVIFINNYNETINLLNNYIVLANALNIKINKNKTKINNISKFIFCKWKYIFNNKLVLIPIKDTIYRQRRKLKKMIKNNINDEIKTTKLCFKAYLNILNCYKYINSLVLF